MSKEYIERGALIEWLDKVDGIIADGTVEAPTLYKQVITDIKQFPAANVVELPCKIGDTVYFETFDTVNNRYIGIQPHKIVDFRLDMMVERKGCVPTTYLPYFYFGESVFLTKEEAERALNGGTDNG